jgi:hypothetical protein
MLGATWGLVPSFIPDFEDLVREFWEEVYNTDDNKHGFDSGLGRGRFFGVDQEFLSRMIWPRIQEHHLAHDENFKFTGKEKQFPYPREYLPDMYKAKEPYIGMCCQLEPEWENYKL